MLAVEARVLAERVSIRYWRFIRLRAGDLLRSLVRANRLSSLLNHALNDREIGGFNLRVLAGGVVECPQERRTVPRKGIDAPASSSRSQVSGSVTGASIGATSSPSIIRSSVSSTSGRPSKWR